MRLWLRFAWRDLRSGLQGFWIFLSCLALGTAGIAIVGSLAASIERGLVEQGQPLLGGDIEFALIHREADAEQRAWLEAQGSVSAIATLRAMAIAGGKTVLVEVKAVDGFYPLYGALDLKDGETLTAALSGGGAVVDEILLSRLGIETGGTVRVGTAEFPVAGAIAREPDRLSDGIVFGPRVLMSRAALERTGLIQPGSLITWRYRAKLPGTVSPRSVETAAEARFPQAGWRIRTRDEAAQGADRFVERIAYFMTLAGITALIAGGAGIANAVGAFVARRMASIATLKCLGAQGGDIFGIYLVQILIVGALAIGAGLLAGAAAPPLAHRLLAGILPLPLTPRIEVLPLASAAAFGMITALAFSIWPLAQARRIPASALFRHRAVPPSGRPPPRDLAAIGLLIAAAVALVYLEFEDTRVTTYYLGGLAVAFLALVGLARGIVRLAARAPKPPGAVLRYAVANLHRPGATAASAMLALGLGLSLFVTLALTDGTISRELLSGIPKKAPSFYVLDIPARDRDPFLAFARSQPGVTAVETAPMLRGRIVRVKDVPSEKVAADPEAAWVLRGDRGLTYADTLPEGSRLVEGTWWPKDYTGEPLVSFVDDAAAGLGLKPGDKVTVNVLGRDVTATVANLRAVDWRSLEINFVMVFSPNTLKAAPHNNLATIEMSGGDEAKFLNDLARAYPSVTAIRVKDAIELVADLLGKMLAAIRGASALTLLTGMLVLAGALAAGLANRVYDAVVLKTYGATRRQLMLAFAAEYAAIGLAAAVFGIAAGSAGSWFLAYWILEMPWQFSFATAAATALAAMLVAVAAGLAVTFRALTIKPAPLLRNE